jgi:hypothetical protein
VLTVSGVLLVVLAAAVFVSSQAVQGGVQCDADGTCTADAGAFGYLAGQLARTSLNPVAHAGAAAALLGGFVLLLTPGAGRRVSPHSQRADASADPIGATVPPIRLPRHGIAIAWVLVSVLLGVSFAVMVATSLPEWSMVWSSGVCDSNGCVYPLDTQIALTAGALAPPVFGAALVAVPLLVLLSALLPVALPTPAPASAGDVVAGARAERDGRERDGVERDAVADARRETPGRPDAPSELVRPAALPVADPADGGSGRRARRAARVTSWDGADLSPFMRPDPE